jgi:iron complex outermembrane recepter protein
MWFHFFMSMQKCRHGEDSEGRRFMKRFGLTSVALVCIAHAISMPALAQNTPQAGDETASDGEIIVTAQRRDQRLQDVPLAVTAISGEALASGRINSITDLQTSTPGLTAVTNNRPGTSSSFSLRGVGTSGNDSGLEAAVGFSVDGVPRIRSGAGLGDFVDIESVEVLRGPQGTLFGKNTTAGVIQVTSRKPDLENVDGFMEATYGNYNLTTFRGAVNAPVAPGKAALRFSFGYNKRDGFLTDVSSGARYNNRDRFNFAGKLLLQASESVEILLSADYAEVDESCCQSVRFTNAQAPGGGNAASIAFLNALATSHGNTFPVTPTPTAFLTSVNGPVVNANKDRGVQMQIKADLGGVDLTSISSYRKFGDVAVNDVDFTGADLVRQRVTSDLSIFTQELRLQGSAFDGKLDWLVGGFYASDKVNFTESVSSGTDLNAFFSASSALLRGLYPTLTDAYGTRAQQKSKAYALFTHNIINITEKLHLTTGLRWTKEDKSAVSNPFFNGPNNASILTSALSPIGSRSNSYNLDLNDDAFSGTAAIDYRWTPDVMTYASYSRGFKAGGFGLGRDAAGPVFSRNPACAPAGATPVLTTPVNVFQCTPVDPRFKPETVQSYEIGLRSQFIDRRLTFNLTLFEANFKNLQLNTFTGFGFFLSNAGTAKSKGAELELGFKVADGIRLGGNLNYLDATFGRTVPAVVTGEPALAGQRLNFASKWSGAFNADFDIPVSDNVDLFARPEVYFRSSFAPPTRTTSTGAFLFLPSVTLFNLSGGVRVNDKWSVSAFCRNCTNKHYLATAFASVAQTGSRDGFLANPAEYGVSARFDF